MGNDRKLPNFKIDRADSRSLVCQVADGLRSAIMTGFYRPGCVLPSRTQLSEALGVSPRVTREALRKMADEGLASPRKRLGSIVLPRGSSVWNGNVLLVWRESDEGTYFAIRFVSALRRVLVANGYLLTSVTIGTHGDGRPNLSVLESALARRFDVAIVFKAPCEAIGILARHDVRQILVNAPQTKSKSCIGYASLDARACYTPLVERCRLTGVRDVVIAGFNNRSIKPGRFLEKSGMSVENLTVNIIGKHPIDQLDTQVRKAMVATDRRFGKSQRRMPDAIIFTDDFFAMGAILALALNGIRIPEDVKVATISNKGFAPVHPQQLTRIEYDFAEYGKIVADYTIAHLTGRNAPRRIAVSPVFIPGETL